MTTMDILRRTKAAWPSICNATAEEKNRILSAMADSLQAECDAILRCNAEDMDAARGHISDVMLDRLYLDRGRIDAMADGIRATVALPDHTGRILAQIDNPNGMKIYKKQVPLGLVAIIYESRPNVTSDAAALAIKSGNVCMLRSGKEAFHTAKAIVAALKQGIASVGGDPDIVNIVEDTSHQSATEIMQAKGLVDLLIPRGGAGLIRACVQNATVPCIETGTGICHVYVDEYADLDKAVRIIENAKTSRPSVCNAEEVCLVHRAVAAEFLPMLKKVLVAFGDQVGFADTLDEALDQVFGGDSGANAGDADHASGNTQAKSGTTDTGSSGAGQSQSDDSSGKSSAKGSNTSGAQRSPELQQALDDASQAMQDGQNAMKNGDWSAYGEAQKKLQEALNKAVELSK